MRCINSAKSRLSIYHMWIVKIDWTGPFLRFVFPANAKESKMVAQIEKIDFCQKINFYTTAYIFGDTRRFNIFFKFAHSQILSTYPVFTICICLWTFFKMAEISKMAGVWCICSCISWFFSSFLSSSELIFGLIC
jgi:hypothetical protein